MEALASRLATAPSGPRPPAPVPVALVITDLDVGGAERALVALAQGLDRARWTPSVTCLGPEGALAEPLRAAGIDVDCLGVNPRRPVAAVARLASRLRRLRPALVQSFLFHANIAARLAAPMAGRPWVVGGLRVAERRANSHMRLDRATIRLAAGSVCVSEGVARFAREEGRLPADRLAVIPNGVDVGPFDRAEPADRGALGVPVGDHLALFIGRIDEQKGVSDLLEGAERVASSRPDWSLVIAGDGPDREFWEQEYQCFPHLPGRVRWLGRRDDVPALLKAADVLVLPSLWEGMPNVVLEAMAARRAVVASAVEGTEDLVVPGQTGWLFPPGNFGRLAKFLEEAATDPERLRRYGEAGRERVEAEFAPGRVVTAYDRLWSRLLGYEV